MEITAFKVIRINGIARYADRKEITLLTYIYVQLKGSSMVYKEDASDFEALV